MSKRNLGRRGIEKSKIKHPMKENTSPNSQGRSDGNLKNVLAEELRDEEESPEGAAGYIEVPVEKLKGLTSDKPAIVLEIKVSDEVEPHRSNTDVPKPAEKADSASTSKVRENELDPLRDVHTPETSGVSNELPELNTSGESLHPPDHLHISISENNGVLNSCGHSNVETTPNAEVDIQVIGLENGQSLDIEVPVISLVENNLYHFFNGSSDGKMVVKYYRENGRLNNTMRKQAVDLVMRFELSEDAGRKITRQEFEEMAEGFVELFPTELKLTYFIPFHKIGTTSCNAKGSLWDKYNNLKRQYRKAGLISKNQSTTQDKKEPTTYTLDPSVTQADLESDLDYLSRYPGPLSEVIPRWKRTAPSRLAKFESSNQPINEYIAQYPALGVTGQVSDLIEIDFKLKYPNCGENLHSLMPRLSKEVVQFAKKKFPEDRTFRSNLVESNIALDHDNSGYVLCFMLLALLIPLPSAGRKRKSAESEVGAAKRLSKLEAQKGFILHVRSKGCLKTDVDARVEELRKSGHSNVSFVVIVGKDYTNLEHYVYFNNEFYKTLSAPHSVDLCFKLFMVLDAKYPSESTYIWKFIQQFVYKFPPECELPCLITLAGDLKLLQEPPEC